MRIGRVWEALSSTKLSNRGVGCVETVTKWTFWLRSLATKEMLAATPQSAHVFDSLRRWSSVNVHEVHHGILREELTLLGRGKVSARRGERGTEARPLAENQARS